MSSPLLDIIHIDSPIPPRRHPNLCLLRIYTRLSIIREKRCRYRWSRTREFSRKRRGRCAYLFRRGFQISGLSQSVRSEVILLKWANSLQSVDYHSFLKSPPLPIGQHIHPLHEMPNPAPAPTVPDELEMPHQLGSALQDPTLDPDYYHRNSKAIPSTRTEMPSRSVAHPRTVTHGHGDNSENDSHPNRRKHGKHRHHHRRSHSHDRTSEHQSVITAYRKIEPVSGPADRVGE